MQNPTPNLIPEIGKEAQSNWGEAAGSNLPSANNVSSNGQSLIATAQHTNYATESGTESDEDEDSEVESFHLDQQELDEDSMFEPPKYLLSGEGTESPDLQSVDPETQARLEALLEAAGIGKLSTADGKHFADPEVLRKLTSSVSCALDEAAAALSRMRAESASHLGPGETSLTEACSDGDAGAVKKLLEEGRSVNETTEEGDSLLSLACQAGYYELAQVLLAMRANVEDRGIKGDCTPLMEAASAGHVDIVKLLINHNADVNAQSSSGNTPLMYACAGGHEDVVLVLLGAGANVEDHNENGHTPLMEAASAGHVGVAKILLDHGAGVNTHSNEFKESALTLACYKGHLEMVRFLLSAGADQEHKTDEMHTALMEASMDGHVEVARLLLDSGAQVNMPADSFESPLTLAACGGHVELAMLLLERGANIEEVNDEGYTPLMEAAREGHEEMVALLLSQGADINAQTEETQETALTLACCGGFLEVADFLIKAGADIELGASTPLMEAAQEGRLELVKYLLSAGANVHACTQTNDTALTYACENGHTDVADLLLQAGADLEHESEGGRTPLMKAARAGHICTVQFLITRGADINHQTTNNDHTPLSLACAGGHLVVVELLLGNGADPAHRLKDNSTMLIEASKGGHTSVVQYLLDYPNSVVATSTPPDLSQLSTPTYEGVETHRVPPHGMPHPAASEPDQNPGVTYTYYHSLQPGIQAAAAAAAAAKQDSKQPVLRTTNASVRPVETLTTAELQQVKNAPHLAPSYQPDFNYDFDGALVKCVGEAEVTLELEKDVKPCERLEACINNMMKKAEQLHHNREEQILQKQQILEELQRVERELQEKAQAQIMLSAQAQLRIEHHAGQGLAPPCSLGSTSATAQSLGGSLLELGQGIGDGQLGLGFKSPMALPVGALPPCLIEGTPSMSPVGVTPASPTTSTVEKFKGKLITKKDTKAIKQTAKAPQQEQLIDEMEKLNVKGLPSESFVTEVFQGLQLPSKALNCQDRALLERLQVSCGEPSLEDVISASQAQVQSQDSAVVSVVMGVNPMQTTGMVAAVQHDEKAVKNKCLKSITGTQVKNSVNNVTVNTCYSMGNIPLSTAGAIPQLPSSQQVVLSQQHCVPTSTVATQYIDPSLPTSSLTSPFLATPSSTPAAPQVPLQSFPVIDVNSQTDSNHDTALTLACAGGHEELVQLLLARGADIGMEFEHRDKKGFTPLILAATAGHAGVVDILLNHGADIEAQSERTKDTPLSLACSGGRFEVVEILLNRGANKEHRNVSDYTPLSLAASGGYVNIIKLLLNHGAEINSRTGSKLGISPLMLAAMNGHTAAVKLLLDMGSDINAQIETNRNTALTLACFQGRHEVVSLLVDRKANVEHRAKTGLTPLMEAASGGYVEVGRVLLDKGADVNAPPVPSSRDTALTIAADKGHYRFVELLLTRGAQVDVKNKKGNSPLWLAANGGHLDVVQLLASAGAEIDSQDNRKVSCLMAAFRKGHIKVVKWMVKIVTQFPSDQEMTRYIATFNDNELLKKCQQCLEIIRIAKDRQAVEANKNATILFEELDMEKNREENKKAAAARRRERKRKKKKEKQERKQLEEENKKNEAKNQAQEIEKAIPVGPPVATLTTTVGTVISMVGKNSNLNSCMSQNGKTNVSQQGLTPNKIVKGNPVEVLMNANCTSSSLISGSKIKMVKENLPETSSNCNDASNVHNPEENDIQLREKLGSQDRSKNDREGHKERRAESKGGILKGGITKEKDKVPELSQTSKEKAIVAATAIYSAFSTEVNTMSVTSLNNRTTATTCSLSSSASSSSASSNSSSSTTHTSSSDRKREPTLHHHHYPHHHQFSSSINAEEHSASITYVSNTRSGKSSKKADSGTTVVTSNHRNPSSLPNNLKTPSVMSSPKRGSKREEGWKEVVRKSYMNFRSKKVMVPANAISRVIGRGGSNINTIREVSGAVIEVEKQKGAGDRAIIIRGSADSTKQAHQLISMMIKDPDRDLSDLLPKSSASKASTNVKIVSSSQSGSANQASVSLPLGIQAKSTIASSFLKSNSLSVTSGITYPPPPFSAPTRQATAARPGMALNPAFPSQSSWPAFSGPCSLSVGKKSSSITSVLPLTSTAMGSSAQEPLCGSTINNATMKSPAARQLFPPEKKATVSQTNSSTCTKTTVSYTTAVLGSGKGTKMVPSSSTSSFASKITESRQGTSATGKTLASGQQGKGVAKAASNNGVKLSQSGSNINQHVLPSRSTSLPNGPIPSSGHGASASVSGFSASSSSQPGTPTMSSPSSLPAPPPSGPNRPATPPSQMTPCQNSPQDFHPFNSTFSHMALSVWGKDKECSNKGMNFASVAAGNVKTSSAQLCSATSATTSVDDDDDSCAPPPVDAAKAPGYRGNAHISPGSLSGVSSGTTADHISSSSRSCLPNSASSTPPIGPIAPPSGITLRKSSSPVDSMGLSSSAPAVLGPGSLNSTSGNHIGLRHPLAIVPPSGHMSAIASHNLQPPVAHPALDLNPINPTYVTLPQHSPSQNFSGPYTSNAISNNTYSSSSSGSMGNTNSNSITSIQSNLNPNAPDFSSRSLLNNSGNPHHPSQTHPPSLAALHLGRPQGNPLPFHNMHGVAQSSVVMPNFASSTLNTAVSSTQSSGIASNASHSSVASSQTSGMKRSFPNSTLSSDYSHLNQPTPNMVSNPDAVHLMNSIGPLNHHQLPGPLPAMNTGAPNIAALQQFTSMPGPLISNQRLGNLAHSVASSSSSSSKEESSNISPVSSPHPSNPSSPMTYSVMTDTRPVVEDRKLPRPIGTERAHKKTPQYNEYWGAGNYRSNEPLQDERNAPVPSYGMHHFGDGLGTVMENNHPINQNFQHSLMTGPQPRHSSGFPFNGLQQPMMVTPMPLQYASLNRDIWRDSNNMKLAVGESDGPSETSVPTLPIGLNHGHGPFGPGPQQQSLEHKMIWNTCNWSQGQM